MIKGNTKRRRLAWLSAAFFTGAALLMPATIGSALAIQGSQSEALPISSTNTEFQGTAEECKGTPDNTVVWHFVQTSPGASSGTLTATFATAGVKVQPNADSPANVLHWYVSTGKPDTLTAYSSDVAGEEGKNSNLVLSHICQGVTVTTTTTGTTTTGTTTTGTTTTGTTTTGTTTTGTTTTGTVSETTTVNTTTTGTGDVSGTTTVNTTTTGTGDVSGTTTVNTTTAATGNVSGTSSTKTLPETSMVEPTSPVNSGMVSLALLLLGVGSLMLLVLTPVQARKRD